MIFAEHSICYYSFDSQKHMDDFIEKYKNFKIYDENGRVYPVHISRAINQDQVTEEITKETEIKQLEETPEFKEFFESLTSETKVLPSLESQKKEK